MKTNCPNCGGEVEFRYDDSFVRVCAYCRTAIARTDRGVDSLGKVADLVPIESPLRLFADGHYGSESFILVGMAQIRHSAGGIWQEWYAKLDGGKWGWLAEAQGRYYLTFEVTPEGERDGLAPLPDLGSLAPGTKVDLPAPGRLVSRSYTVGELSEGTYIAANGELPFRLVPDGAFRYVDLSDGEGSFATIDYGEPGDTPSVYIGQQVSLEELGIHGGEIGPSREAKIGSTRLACPACNAPIELQVPDQAQRVVCSHCNHMLGVEGSVLQLLKKLPGGAAPVIPLGSKGTFVEGPMTVIGFVTRSAEIEGTWYPFYEYLLYDAKVGFRWLVDSDGHWSYVQPIAVGAVEPGTKGVAYDGVQFARFVGAPLRVDLVLGEFYWRVEIDERVESEDFIAPPAMISRETGTGEENWSLSTYMRVDEVKQAFSGVELSIPGPHGVAPHQRDRAGTAGAWLSLGFFALLATGIFFSAAAQDRPKYDHTIEVQGGLTPPAPPAAPPTDPVDLPPVVDPSAAPAAVEAIPNVTFSEPFELDAGKNIQLTFQATIDNNWAYVAADLVNVATGKVSSVDADIEYYSGFDDGDFWSEGSKKTVDVVGPVEAGQYLLRTESQAGGTGVVPITVSVKQGVFRGKYLAWACLFLGIPLFGFGLHSWSFERKRWENSSQGVSGAPTTPTTIVIAGLAAILGAIVAIIRALPDSD